MNPQLRAWQNRVNKRCDALAEVILQPDGSAVAIHDFTDIRQPGELPAEAEHPAPGSPQVTEALAVARMASALRELQPDHLSIDWRRNRVYIDVGLTDAEIEAPGHDKAALRSEYIRRNGMIALDSCAVAAGRGANDALNCMPFEACPYDDPILRSEWKRGYGDTVAIVGDRPAEQCVVPRQAAE